MSKGPSTFKQADLTRALKAAQAAGIKVRIKIGSDGMVIEMVDANGGEIGADRNEWDIVGVGDGAH
jgi:phosphatidylserine/phosphatidylglycerophosphate/cardiolipin synthase-like enzyme